MADDAAANAPLYDADLSETVAHHERVHGGGPLADCFNLGCKVAARLQVLADHYRTETDMPNPTLNISCHDGLDHDWQDSLPPTTASAAAPLLTRTCKRCGTTMFKPESDRTTGLRQKYVVERTDGKPIEHGCIVLEWDDPNARKGIAAFAKAVREDGYGQLANDLDGRLAGWAEADDRPKHAASCDRKHPPGPCPVPKPEGWNPVA